MLGGLWSENGYCAHCYLRTVRSDWSAIWLGKKANPYLELIVVVLIMFFHAQVVDFVVVVVLLYQKTHDLLDWVPIKAFKVLRWISHCDDVLVDVWKWIVDFGYFNDTELLLTWQIQIKSILFIPLLLLANNIFDCICHLDVCKRIRRHHVTYEPLILHGLYAPRLRWYSESGTARNRKKAIGKRNHSRCVCVSSILLFLHSFF